MFKVEVMKPKDFGFAVELTNTMNWNMELEDFKFNRFLERNGCFTLFDDKNQVGVATCIGYGNVGWFGNLIIKPEYQQRGAGSLLVKCAIDFLHSKSIEAVGLYAYEHLKDFYSKLGFVADEDFVVLHSEKVKRVCDLDLSEQCSDISLLASFDEKCFGGDRKRVLEAIIAKENNLCFSAFNENKLCGYVLVKRFSNMAEVGPLVCESDNQDVACGLLSHALSSLGGLYASICLPKKQKFMIDYLVNIGFVEDFILSRMFLGSSRIQNCIYAAESLERG